MIMFGKNNNSGIGNAFNQATKFGMGAIIGKITVDTIKKQEQMKAEHQACLDAIKTPKPKNVPTKEYNGEIGKFLNLPDNFYEGFGIPESQIPSKNK